MDAVERDLNGTPLKDRPYLTIPEAQRLCRVARSKVLAMIESGRWTSFVDGKRTKIVTSSILEDVDRTTREARERAGLDEPR